MPMDIDIDLPLAFLFRIHYHRTRLQACWCKRDKLLGAQPHSKFRINWQARLLTSDYKPSTMSQNRDIDDEQASLISSQSKKPTPDTLTSTLNSLLLLHVTS